MTMMMIIVDVVLKAMIAMIEIESIVDRIKIKVIETAITEAREVVLHIVILDIHRE